MLRLLLDEHISPDVSESLVRADKEVIVFSLLQWEDGRFLGASDPLLLHEAARQAMTLVTYDRRTIPPLLKDWAEIGRDHGGIIFVDENTIPPSDVGGLARALHQLFRESRRWDWPNRICFLRR